MNKNTLDLLKDLSEIVGIDIRLFFASQRLSDLCVRSAAGRDNSQLPLGRLITAFQALPSQESRERAIQFLEALAGEAHLSRANAS